jgi:hypothetical protein
MGKQYKTMRALLPTVPSRLAPTLQPTPSPTLPTTRPLMLSLALPLALSPMLALILQFLDPATRTKACAVIDAEIENPS